MGGLEKGELASATVIHSMINWFENDFPNLLYENYTASMIKNSWMQTILKVNESICNYGEEHHIQLGTTLTALLLVEDVYYICNVGDSRIYYLDSGIRQITRDQSYVQQEIDMERMTEEEALKSDKRNILLQCIGARNQVTPDFYFGEYQTSSACLLCTDGFRHVINNQEMWDTLRPDLIENELDIERKILKLLGLHVTTSLLEYVIQK